MKATILKILNKEKVGALNRAELAKKNQDLVSMLANKRLVELIEHLIVTVQDHA